MSITITITQPAALITLESIAKAEQDLLDYTRDLAELERINANYELTGEFEPIRPELGPDAVIPLDLLKRSA